MTDADRQYHQWLTERIGDIQTAPTLFIAEIVSAAARIYGHPKKKPKPYSVKITEGNLAEGEFGGTTFDSVRDESRLRGHLLKTYQLLKSGRWYSDEEIAVHIGCKPATAGARRRDLKKRQFGGFPIEQRRSNNGQWEYRMLPA